jgi:sec-independent protein translocase protein TatA
MKIAIGPVTFHRHPEFQGEGLMFGIGTAELAVIAAIVVLIFGPRQIPRMGKALGDTIRELRGIGKELSGPDDKDRS